MKDAQAKFRKLIELLSLLVIKEKLQKEKIQAIYLKMSEIGNLVEVDFHDVLKTFLNKNLNESNYRDIFAERSKATKEKRRQETEALNKKFEEHQYSNENQFAPDGFKYDNYGKLQKLSEKDKYKYDIEKKPANDRFESLKFYFILNNVKFYGRIVRVEDLTAICHVENFTRRVLKSRDIVYSVEIRFGLNYFIKKENGEIEYLLFNENFQKGRTRVEGKKIKPYILDSKGEVEYITEGLSDDLSESQAKFEQLNKMLNLLIDKGKIKTDFLPAIHEKMKAIAKLLEIDYQADVKSDDINSFKDFLSLLSKTPDKYKKGWAYSVDYGKDVFSLPEEFTLKGITHKIQLQLGRNGKNFSSNHRIFYNGKEWGDAPPSSNPEALLRKIFRFIFDKYYSNEYQDSEQKSEIRMPKIGETWKLRQSLTDGKNVKTFDDEITITDVDDKIISYKTDDDRGFVSVNSWKRLYLEGFVTLLFSNKDLKKEKVNLQEKEKPIDTAKPPVVKIAKKVVTEGEEYYPTPTQYVDNVKYPILSKEQLLGINMALTRFKNGGAGFLLADGTGFGKTMQILTVAHEWANMTNEQVLVVTANAQIIANNFTKDSALLKLYNPNVILTTYSMLKNHVGKSYSLVCYDEAQYLKNPDSARSKNSIKIHSQHKLFATATPMDTILGSVHFIKEVTGLSEAKIYDKLGVYISWETTDEGGRYRVVKLSKGATYDTVKHNLQEIRLNMLKDGAFVRRLFPFEGSLEIRNIALPQSTLETIEKIYDYWQTRIDAVMASGSFSLSKIISLGGQRTGEINRFTELQKVDYVMELVKEEFKAGRHIVIIAEGINDTLIKGLSETINGFIAVMQTELAKDGYYVCEGYGANKTAKNNSIINFQKGNCKVILGTPQSIAEGVDLDDQVGTEPRTLVMVTANYSGNVFQQILGRVSRRNTMSMAKAIVVFSNSVTDLKRKSIVETKLAMLRLIQDGKIITGLSEDEDEALKESIQTVEYENNNMTSTEKQSFEAEKADTQIETKIVDLKIGDKIIFNVNSNNLFIGEVVEMRDKAVKVDYAVNSTANEDKTVYTNTCWIPKSAIIEKDEFSHTVKTWYSSNFKNQKKFFIRKWYKSEDGEKVFLNDGLSDELSDELSEAQQKFEQLNKMLELLIDKGKIKTDFLPAIHNKMKSIAKLLEIDYQTEPEQNKKTTSGGKRKLPEISKQEPKLIEKIVYGRKTLIDTPAEKVPAQYAIIEIDNLIPSNDEMSFEPTIDYPAECQTRSYKEDEAEKNKVINFSSHFIPEHLINISPEPTTAMPIVTKEGFVLGGNGRSMILKRVANLKLESWQSYVELLKRECGSYGINIEDVEKFKRPVIVRLVHVNMSHCSKYSNIFNQRTMTDYDPKREGIAYARELKEDPLALESISGLMANSEADTFNKLFDDDNFTSGLIGILKRLKFLHAGNFESIIEAGKFNDKGKKLVENMLLGAVLPDKKLISTTGSYTLKILRAMPFMVRLIALPDDYNIIEHVQESIRMEHARRTHNLSIKDFLNQGVMFGEPPPPLTIEIYKIMQGTGINKFRDFMQYYVRRAEEATQGDNVFGEVLTPIEIIATWLKHNESAVTLSGIDSEKLSEKLYLIKNHAKFLWHPTPVTVTIANELLKVYRDDTQEQVALIDLELPLVITNQDDMFGTTKMSFDDINNTKALFRYIKDIKNSRPKVSKAQESLFDKAKITRLDECVPCGSYETGLDDDVVNEYSQNSIISLADSVNVPLRPLKLQGMTQRLLGKLNEPCMVLVWGLQGSGKSTFVLKMLDDLAINGRCLLFLTEEKISSGRIGARTKIANMKNLEMIDVVDSGDFAELADLVSRGNYKFVAIDSKDNLNVDDSELLDLRSRFDVNFIVVSHTQKSGKNYTGDRRYAFLGETEIEVKQGLAKTLKHRDDTIGRYVNIFRPIRNSSLNYR